MIVADTADIAEDARELIDIDYRDLPAVSYVRRRGGSRARRSCTTRSPGNLAFEFESGDADATASRLRARALREPSHASTASASSAMCSSRARASSRSTQPSDRYTFHIPLQGVGGMKGQLALRDRPRQGQDRARRAGRRRKLRRSRRAAYPEYFAVMLAARKLGPAGQVGRARAPKRS